MKYLFFVLFVSSYFLFSCNSSETNSSSSESLGDSAKIEFENPNHDFGEIKEGEVVSHIFKFKNIGSKPLNIIAVNVTCGCTVAEKPEKPVGVGQEGEIKVEFNSAGKVGINKKYVTVLSDALNSSEVVSFDVIVNNLNKQ